MSSSEPHLRLASAADAVAIAEIYAPIVESTAISFEVAVPTVDEMRMRIEKTLATYPWLVADGDGAVLGYAYAGRWRERAAYRWSVEVTAYVAETSRGQGVGGALYRALFRILEAQGFHRAFAGITLPNDPSVALHESVGFTVVGVFRDAGHKFASWHDVGWYERPIGADGAVPHEPIPLPELAASVVTAALQA
jgi:phosphinothricin acetyltransferase